MKNEKFTIYRVGGSVRDEIMGIPSSDNDFVVVGANHEDMIASGLTRVGLDFPVYIDNIGDQYALARKERKTGEGYTGFETETENVTLEEDLMRRDFRCNSIAKDLETGEYIDPFGGIADIKNEIICHTSAAFSEDPVRVLRAARFATKYGFSIHATTEALCKKIVQSDDFKTITPERVGIEVNKILSLPNAYKFFEILHRFGALEILFPEFTGIPMDFRFTMDVMRDINRHMEFYESKEVSPILNFSALCFMLNVPDIKNMVNRIGISHNLMNTAKIVSVTYHNVWRWEFDYPHDIVKTIEHIGTEANVWYVTIIAANIASRWNKTPIDTAHFLKFRKMAMEVLNVKARDIFPIESLKAGTIPVEVIKKKIFTKKCSIVDSYQQGD